MKKNDHIKLHKNNKKRFSYVNIINKLIRFSYVNIIELEVQ